MVKSRQSADRAKLQRRLQDVLDELNDRYEADLRSKFLITVGDEFQGLLRRGENLPRMLAILTAEVPNPIRFGIGAGVLSTDAGEFAIGSDGPAWHNARAALERVGKRAPVIDRHVGFGADDLVLDGCLSGFRTLLGDVSPKQWAEVRSQLIGDSNPSSTTSSNKDYLLRRAHFRSLATIETGLAILYSRGLESEP